MAKKNSIAVLSLILVLAMGGMVSCSRLSFPELDIFRQDTELSQNVEPADAQVTEKEEAKDESVSEKSSDSMEELPYVSLYQTYLDGYAAAEQMRAVNKYYSENEPLQEIRFTLCQVDEDEVPELVIFDNYSEQYIPENNYGNSGYYATVCTIQENRVIALMQMYLNNGSAGMNSLYYTPYANLLWLNTQLLREEDHILYRIVGDEMALFERGGYYYRVTGGRGVTLLENGLERTADYIVAVGTEEDLQECDALQKDLEAWIEKHNLYYAYIEKINDWEELRYNQASVYTGKNDIRDFPVDMGTPLN